MSWTQSLAGGDLDDMSTFGWGFEGRATAKRKESVISLRREPFLPGWPHWADTVVRRVLELDRETVDSSVARPLNRDDALAALEFLVRVMHDDTSPPWVGRLTSGGIQLAWRHGDVEVEVVFDRLRDDSVLVVEVGDREWEAPSDAADSLFASIVDRLSTTFIEHPGSASAAT
jgi:hypothetical protein